MASNFTDILRSKKIISEDQLTEANRLAGESGKMLHEELLRLGYASPEKIMKALAKSNGMPFVDLKESEVPETVIDLVPESVARENAVMPYREDGGRLYVATSDPTDIDTQEKLRFILNRDIEMAIAMRDQIIESINKYYGAGDGESADSMLTQEFTDTEIDLQRQQSSRKQH